VIDQELGSSRGANHLVDRTPSQSEGVATETLETRMGFSIKTTTPEFQQSRSDRDELGQTTLND
jgi:hypothetical protein